MVRVNTIVRHLPSVETLGCVDVVCTDKTGTLTENKMSVAECYADMKLQDASQGMSTCSSATCEHFLQALVLCNDASISGNERIGDPTELALLDFAAKNSADKAVIERKYPRTDEIPFDSVRKMMTTFHAPGISYTKGSPAEVLKCCNITPSELKRLEPALSSMTEKGLRVLAVAMKDNISHASENNMTFLGFVGMIDPPRPEALPAVREFARAGVRTVMITGDRPDTAFAIARQLNIASRLDECISGEELASLSDRELSKKLRSISVFAHVSPEHKMRIVDAYKAAGSIVAMTGDGVNDAPSLKAADVGIAMGISGCDVAKNAADIVLTDDNFATIAKAIEMGRCIYENIRKSVIFLLSSNLGEILTMLFAVLFALPTPLKSSHILWVNLITDSLPALALGIDEEDGSRYMNRKPRRRDESLFAGGGAACSVFYGVLIATISIIAFLHLPLTYIVESGMRINISNISYYLSNAASLARAQTYSFTVLGLAQLFHAVGMRDVETSVFRMDHRSNKLMIAALISGICMQLAVTEIPRLSELFGTKLLSAGEWVGLIILSAAPLFAHEILIASSRNP
jgi:Ca2+-transporting ATPase